MFGIAKAISSLAAALEKCAAAYREMLAWNRSNAVTRSDLADAKKEIVKAFGERVDPAKVNELSRASDKLEKAVADNQPISGS